MNRYRFKRYLGRFGTGFYAAVYVVISLFPLLFSFLSSFKDNMEIGRAHV